MKKRNKAHDDWYVIGFFEHDGSFNVLSDRKLGHNMFATWEEAQNKCKKLQPYFKHHLEPHYV